MAQLPISGVIIADKRFWLPAGDPASTDCPAVENALLEPLLALMTPLVDDMVWVASDPAALLARDGLIVRDHFQPPGLLSAIHAGLFASRHEHALVLVANRLLPSMNVLTLLLQAAAPRWDAVLLEIAGPQPLPAIYHKRCLKLLTRQLTEGRRQPDGFLRQLHRHLISEDLVRQADAQWAAAFLPPT